MAKTEMTKQIENLLYSYNPTELAGQKLNKFRPHFVVNECVVETGNIRSGIVDVMRLDETLTNKQTIRTCSGYNLFHKADTSFSQYYHIEDGACQKQGEKLPHVCDNQSCVLNYPEYKYDYDLLITCFEIKVTKTDFHSKNGHNFCGNANFYVMPQLLYKEVKNEIPDNIGVISVQSGNNTIQLRKVKDATYQTISYADRLWLVLNILKKHSKEQKQNYEKKLEEAYNAEQKAKGDLFALQYKLQ